MSSETPMVSSVRDVLLYTAAPSASSECTVSLASALSAATIARMPFRSSAVATAAMRSRDATRENSESPTSGRATGVVCSATDVLREVVVHQGDGHRSLADRSGASLD